jgi:hypothetical protein
MGLYNYSFYPLLTGGLNFKPGTATIRAFLSLYQIDNGPYLSNYFTPGWWGTARMYDTSAPIPFSIVKPTAPYNPGTVSVYLSTGTCFFPFITSDYSNNNFSLYTFLDTGDINTSFLLTRNDFGPAAIYGPTYYTLNQNQLFYMTDGTAPPYQNYNGDATLYRGFRSNLLSGVYTPQALSSYAIALLDSSYVFDINHTNYSNISSSVVATKALTATIPWHSDNPYGYNPVVSSCELVTTLSAVTGNTITQAVIYLSSTNVTVPKDLVAIYQNYNNDNNIPNLPFTPIGTDVYWEFRNQIIYSLF